MPKPRLSVCHVTLSLYPDAKDGSAKFTRGIFDGLRARGHEVRAITSRWNQTIDDPDVVQLPVPRGRFFWLPSYTLGTIRKLAGRDFDVLHGNGSRGSLPLALTRRDYVTTIHDLGPFEAKFTAVPVVPVLEKLNATRAKMIVTCSKIVQRGIHHYVPKAGLEKMRCVYSAVDPRFRPDPAGAARVREQLGLTGPTVLYVGRIAFYKGVEHLLAAFRKLRARHPEYQLVVGGTPTFRMRQAYEAWKGEHPDVKFVGMVPDELLPAYYTAADAFATYSSASEGFGLTPVEALACGTPVVCSSLAAYREVLREHAVFVPPESPDALAAALERVLEDENLRRRLVEGGRRFVERYTWDAVVEALERAYYEYLGWR
ncbi:MAG: glycosyltransferase family 1 protein [Promethearchaeota archaeon]